MKGLNLGCGQRFHKDWTNVDRVARTGVLAHDLNQHLPFRDEEFDVVYHSHVLEHFRNTVGLDFLRECNRICRHGGVIRVAVPDLEQIVRLYLSSFEKAILNDSDSVKNYDWVMLELYDQAVREHSGGAMITYLSQNPLGNEQFILNRNGTEVRKLLDDIRTEDTEPVNSLSLAVRMSRGRTGLLEKFRRLVLGQADYRALQLGRFRQTGEVHQWMYDRFSLRRALEMAGFTQASVVGPAESQISGWAEFHLDTEEDGTVYKPDSLYMEAVRP